MRSMSFRNSAIWKAALAFAVDLALASNRETASVAKPQRFWVGQTTMPVANPPTTGQDKTTAVGLQAQCVGVDETVGTPIVDGEARRFPVAMRRDFPPSYRTPRVESGSRRS